jgi:hypothetical protein
MSILASSHSYDERQGHDSTWSEKQVLRTCGGFDAGLISEYPQAANCPTNGLNLLSSIASGRDATGYRRVSQELAEGS